MLKHKIAIAAALMLAACASAPQRVIEAGDPVTAFVGVTVLPMDGQGRLQDQTVVVRNGRIIAVGPSRSVVLPDDATRLGRPGQYVMPGLADMHVHYGFPDDGILHLANGVTTVRNMWGQEWTLRTGEAIASGAAHGPAIYSAGPLIDGPGSFWPGASIAETPDDVRRYVAQTAEQGFIAVKLYDRLTPEAFRAGVEEARARGLFVYSHVPDAMSLEEVLALRVDSIEHLEGAEYALSPDAGPASYVRRELIWANADPARMGSLARRIAESGVWLAPTLIVRMAPAASFADMDAAQERAEMRYVHPGTLAFWRGAYERGAGNDRAQALANTRAGHAMRLQLLRAAHAAGANLLVGSDTPNPFVHVGVSLHEELAFYRAAGIPAGDILRIATADAARFLNEQGEFGVVAEGARADLLLLDADPETDLDTLRTPAGVMAAGRWYDSANLSDLLEGLAARVEAARTAAQ